jgi:hypothetical protein
MYLKRISDDDTGDVVKRRSKFSEHIRIKITNLNKENKAKAMKND